MLSNILNILISNLISLVISLLAAFVTPLVLGHNQFGWYKIFTLYVTYVPLLHIGFIDGVLVNYAGQDFKNINFAKFRSYTRFILFLEFILSCLMFIFALFFITEEHNKEIWIALSLYSFSFNMVTYFQFFSRAVMRFSEFAMVTRLQSFITLVYLLLALALFKFHLLHVNLSYYLFFMVCTQILIVTFYLFQYRSIIFGRSYSILSQKRDIIHLVKSGFIIMFSYQLIMFMVNADNQFISMFFPVKTYGEYAFAYSMAGILLTIFMAASSVMLPYMNKAGKNVVIKKHTFNVSIISIVVFGLIISYYPIVVICDLFLKPYLQSVKYLGIIFPSVAVTCVIQSYIFNNYIFLKKMKSFCSISLCNLALDYIVYLIVFSFYGNSYIIAVTSIPLLLIWYLSLELFMHVKTKVRIFKNYVYITFMSFGFLLINQYFNLLYGLLIYILYYLIFTYVFNRENIEWVINKFLYNK